MVKCLDHDSPGWRKNSVLQLDGASYHNAEKTIKLFKELNLPVVISSPYSFDGSPIELYFANFKRGIINPEQFPTSKSKSHSSS